MTLGDLGRPEQARPLLERALAINEAAYGPDHPAVVVHLNHLAGILRDLGQPDEAQLVLERGLAMSREAESGETGLTSGGGEP